MPFMVPLLVGTAGTAGGAAATSGLIGAGGAVTAGGVMTGAGLGLTGYSALAGRQAAKDQADSQEALAAYNAQVAEQDAKAKLIAGTEAAKERRQQTRRLISSMRATTAKAGVTTAGSPLLVMLEQAEIGELDAQTEMYNAQVGAGQSTQAAAMSRLRGKSYKQAGKLAAGQSLIGGASQIIGMTAKRYGA